MTPPATRTQASQKVSQDLEDTTPPQGFMMDSSTAFEILHPEDMTGAVGSVEENTSDGVSRGDQHNLTSDEEGKSPVHLDKEIESAISLALFQAH